MKHLLILLFFVLATPVFAQGTGLYQIPACNTGTTSAGTPQPACPGGDVSDTAPYVAPCGDKNASNTTCSIGASAIGAGFAHIGNVANTTFGINGYVMQKSNDKHLLYKVNSDAIRLVEDTTWANGETCSNGNPALQRFSPSTGINFVNRSLKCGGTTTVQSGARNVAFQYNSSLETNPLGSTPACTATHTGDLGGSTSQLIFHGPGLCNGQSVDAIAIANIGGAGAGEVFIYCRDKGLCGWYQGIDFNSHQPSTWTASTDLCNLGKSICKRPPAGDFMDNTPGRAPLTKTDTQNPNLSGLAYVPDTTADSSSFGESLTFPNFSKEDNKFNEMFDPNIGGGELIPAGLQKKVQYPDEQADYDTTQGTAYNEVYALGCGKVSVDKGQTSGDQFSDKATQSKSLPSAYARTQASFNILRSLRTKDNSGSGLQYRAKGRDIIDPKTLKLTSEYYQDNQHNELLGCNDPAGKKLVTSVPISAQNPLQQILASVTQTVGDLIKLITGQTVCTTDQNGEQHCTNLYKATVTKISTATVFLPGSQDMKEKAVGDTQGSLMTFFPNALAGRLSKVNGCTKQNGGTGEDCAQEDLPHYQMHAVKDTFTKTSSCMLLPASIQEQRGTADKDCKLEGAAAVPTQAPTAGAGNYCTASNPSNVTNGPGYTYISDGLIALALNVSKYTCTPAEFIIGTLAGEGRGLNFDGTTNTVLQGNPNESVCRSTACVTNSSGDLGPYSWNSSLYQDQFNTWGKLAIDCFNALGVSSGTPDAKSLGQATCTTAAKFWGSMHDNGRPVGSCSGANQRSYSLTEIPPAKLELAFRHFCGSNKALCDPFWAKDQNLINFFSSQVARVRSEIAACLK